MKLTVLTAQDKLTEIRRLYFATTKQSIAADFDRAVQLLKSMETEEERERATVYMEGLAQMQKDWARESRPRGAAGAGSGKPPKPSRPAKPEKKGPSAKPGGPGRPRR